LEGFDEKKKYVYSIPIFGKWPKMFY
jgi:hypothetical protein